MTKKQEYVIVNDPDKLQEIHNENVKEIWVGFNSRHYDQYILKGILCGFDPKKINDYIIVKDLPGYRYSSLLEKIPLINYDVMLGMTDRGLKTLEGFMGDNIKESSVPFDIDRKLTDEEIEETIKYCRHDVMETIQVFMKRVDEFNTMMYFIKHFKLPITALSKTKAQLAAEILGANKKGWAFKDEFDFPIVDCLRLNKYKDVAEWYKQPENHDYTKSQELMVAGVPHKFSWGGGHGARSKYHSEGAFIIIDVTAYYPTMQKLFHFGYRVMDKPENFEFIHDSNVAFKRKGDKKARLPFKIMDNAISGQMKQKSSALYDPMSNNSICINGQMLLLDLIEHLEPYCELIQNNTDGIIIKLKDYNRDFDIIDDIVAEWEERTGLQMDFDTFLGEIYQKDVNNYLIVDRETGAIKAKGAYVKKLSPLDYDFPILNKALVEYMVNSVPIEVTINSCNDLKEFQYVAKVSSKYLYAIKDATFTYSKVNGKKVKSYNNDGCILNEKVLRIFASNNPDDGGVYKVSAKSGKMQSIANSPDHCFIYNDDVNDVKCDSRLDKQWYIDMARKRLRDFGVVA